MPRNRVYPRARAKREALDLAMEQQGRKVKWVATQAGLTATRLRDIRNGVEIPLERAEKIAAALDSTVAELFEVIASPAPAEGRAP